MSIADLKARLADIPDIEGLTMELQGGRIVLRWGAHVASADAAASDAEIESAMRAALALPPLAAIPARQTPTASPHPADVAGSIRDMMESHTRLLGEIHATNLARLQTALDRQRVAAASAVGAVSDKVDAQTDDFLAMIGQYTNAL